MVISPSSDATDRLPFFIVPDQSVLCQIPDQSGRSLPGSSQHIRQKSHANTHIDHHAFLRIYAEIPGQLPQLGSQLSFQVDIPHTVDYLMLEAVHLPLSQMSQIVLDDLPGQEKTDKRKNFPGMHHCFPFAEKPEDAFPVRSQVSL